MALNIKNAEVEQLIAEVAQITGESKTETVRRALIERRQRLAYRLGDRNPEARVRRFLETEIWPTIPPAELGRRLSEAEEDALLGYGSEGV